METFHESQKYHEYLIRVFNEFQKEVQNSVLYLIGDGPLRKDCEEQIKKLGITDRVYFAGSVSDVADRLQAMDLMVFPSKYEGLPNVVLEWQAEGLPCLISDKITKECAPSDLVEFMSIEDDPKRWAVKMEEMISRYDNRVLQAEQGTKALKDNGFEIREATQQLEGIYKELVTK